MTNVVVLAVLTGDGHFLSASGRLPQEILADDGNSREVASRLFREATGLRDGDWALISQVGYVDGDRENWPIVLYCVVLPEKTAVLSHDLRWEPIDSLGDREKYPPSMQALVGMACTNQLMMNRSHLTGMVR
jgi:hypothetical protein